MEIVWTTASGAQAASQVSKLRDKPEFFYEKSKTRVKPRSDISQASFIFHKSYMIHSSAT